MVNLKQSRATNSCVHFSLRNLANGGIHLRLLPSIRSLKDRKCVVSSGCVNPQKDCVRSWRSSEPAHIWRRISSACSVRDWWIAVNVTMCKAALSVRTWRLVRLFRKAIQWVDTAHYLGTIFETLDFVDTHESGRKEGSTRQKLVMLSRIPRTGIKWLHEDIDKTSSWFTRCRNWRCMSIRKNTRLPTLHLINYNMLANPPNKES